MNKKYTASPTYKIHKGLCVNCYKGIIRPAINTHGVAIPTCDHCRAEWIWHGIAEALDNGLK